MPYKDKEVQKTKNREYQKKHYSLNKKYYKDKANEREARIKEDFKKIKSLLKCERCPESHFACLDFHHKNPEEKEISISKAVAMSWSIKRIEKEVNKCIVLCSNCHRKEHYSE